MRFVPHGQRIETASNGGPGPAWHVRSSLCACGHGMLAHGERGCLGTVRRKYRIGERHQLCPCTLREADIVTSAPMYDTVPRK